MKKQLLNIKETAEFIGVSRPTLYKWIKGGDFINPVHSSDKNNTFFWIEAIEKWLAKSNKK